MRRPATAADFHSYVTGRMRGVRMRGVRRQRRASRAGQCRQCGGRLKHGAAFCSRSCCAASKRAGNYRDPPPPTQAEIAAASLQIQAEWSEEERVSRMRVDLQPQAWVLPVVRDPELQKTEAAAG
jgi:hypothetical protein